MLALPLLDALPPDAPPDDEELPLAEPAAPFAPEDSPPAFPVASHDDAAVGNGLTDAMGNALGDESGATVAAGNVATGVAAGAVLIPFQ